MVKFSITGGAAFPVALNQLLRPANQLLPHIIKQQIQNGLTATPVWCDRRQTVVPSTRLQTVLVTLIIPAEKKGRSEFYFPLMYDFFFFNVCVFLKNTSPAIKGQVLLY